MRVLLAGATGAVGRQLVPALVKEGHEVHALSRSAAGVGWLADLGTKAVQADVLDADQIRDVVSSFRPAVIINQVTDLAARNVVDNARARREGTHNLVTAGLDAGIDRFISQSIAWVYAPGVGPAKEDDPLDLEATGSRRSTVNGVAAAEADAARVAEHVVLRYGALYGPGTWNAAGGLFTQQLRAGTFTASAGTASFIHVADAAAAAAAALTWPSGVVNVVDDDPAPGADWVQELCRNAGVPDVPPLTPAAAWERGADNSRLHELGFDLRFPTWRSHLTSS